MAFIPLRAGAGAATGAAFMHFMGGAGAAAFACACFTPFIASNFAHTCANFNCDAFIAFIAFGMVKIGKGEWTNET